MNRKERRKQELKEFISYVALISGLTFLAAIISLGIVLFTVS